MKLADADILRLLPEHISGDSQFAATGAAANPVLGAISKAVPNLLIWARLGHAESKDFLPPLRRLTQARPGLRDLDIETLESLAWQFHVDFREVARTKEELAGMVLNSIPWHRIKGTPASIYSALALCGFSGITIEEHDPNMPWASYQLGFDEIASVDDLARIVAVCREMQPARCKLWRVYVDDYDMRPGVWSGPLPKNTWSNAWWSYYSGDYFPDIPGLDDKGLMVSFGLKRKFQVEQYLPADFLAEIWQEQGRLFVIPRRRLEWSGCDWSDIFTRRHGFFGAAILVGHVGERAVISEIWPDEPWSDKPWGTGEIWDRRLPSWRMFDFGQAKSQGVWSDKSDKSNSTWSGLNCCWSVPYHDMIVGETPKWSGAKWGEKRQRVMRVKIYERFRHFTRLSPAPVNPVFDGSSRAFGESFMALGAAKAKTPVWSADKWSGGIALRGNFFFESVLATLAGGPVEGSEPWPDEAWPEKPWGEVSRYGREYPEWKMWACGDVRAAQTARILDAPKPAICAASLLATIAGETVESSGDWESGEWQDAPWGGIGLVDLERADPAASVSSVSAALVENRIEESGPWPDDIGWQDAEWEAQTLSGLGHYAFGAAISGDNR